MSPSNLKLPSLSRTIWIGVLSSQFGLLALGIFVSSYLVPRTLKENFLHSFDSIAAQTRWAIEKSVSYADFNATEDYLRKVIRLDRVTAAFLLDEKGRCLAFADRKRAGCNRESAVDLQRYQSREWIAVRDIPFTFATKGRQGTQERLQCRLILIADLNFLISLQRRLVGSVLIGFLLLLSISAWVGYRRFSLFRREILAIRERVRRIAESATPIAPSARILESRQIEETVRDVESRLLKLQEERAINAKRAALLDLAAQVAHDVRSPLAALKTVEASLTPLPEDIRALTRMAIRRIQEISEQLLEKNRSSNKPRLQDSGRPVAMLLEEAVLETRTQLGDRPGVVIDVDIAPDSHNTHSIAQSADLTRVVSNFLSNAVDAIETTGRIGVGLRTFEESVSITVRDSGKGIPPNVLPKVGKKGFSFGKAHGNGLGVYHAREAIGRWGGRCAIESTPGSGTKVVITLPIAPALS